MLSSNYTVAIDLDGVLRDFLGGICDRVGIDKATLYRAAPPGDWDLHKGLSSLGIDFDDVWDGLDRAFWLKLEPTPWAGSMLQALQGLFGYTYGSKKCRILTAGSYLKDGTDDEFPYWMHKKIYNKSAVVEMPFAVSHAKGQCCLGANDFLIDDKPANLHAWEAAGGIPILFETFFNCQGDSMYGTHPELEEVSWIKCVEKISHIMHCREAAKILQRS